jgi:16S rRNA processing protein RimM
MDLLEVGRIVKSCGLKGRMKVLSYLESNDILQSIDEVLIKQKSQVVPFSVKCIRMRGNVFFLEVEGIKDPESAQSLVGCDVMIPADRLQELQEDEYYWRDIIGIEVVTEDGHFMGRIVSIFPTGSNDVYVCDGGEREILLPAISDVVRHIDMERRRMVVRLLDGL